MASEIEQLTSVLTYVQAQLRQFQGASGTIRQRATSQASVVSQQLGNRGQIVGQSITNGAKKIQEGINDLKQAEIALQRKISALQQAANAR
jgi:hypothetical protein